MREEIIHLETARGVIYDVNRNCEKIVEHSAAGEGDRWFYDVYRSNKVARIFDPVEVVFEVDQ